MTYLVHFTLVNTLIIFAQSIEQDLLPITNFKAGTKLDYKNNNGLYVLNSNFEIYGKNIQSIQIPDIGAIYLKGGNSFQLFISVFDGDKIIGGDIYYKEVSDQLNVTQMMSSLPNVYRAKVKSRIELTPNLAFVVTWENVTINSTTNQVNTFQLVLISNKTHTSVLLAYVTPMSLQGADTMVAKFSDTDGNVFYLPGSDTKAVVNLAEDSNFLTDEATGLWVYNLWDTINKEAVNNFNAPCTEEPTHDGQLCNNDLVCTDVQGKGFGRCLCPVGLVLVGDTGNSCKLESTTRMQPTSTSTGTPETEATTPNQPASNNDMDITLYAILIACACAIGISISVCCIKKYIDKKRRESTTTASSNEENGSSSKSSENSKKGFASIMNMLMKKERIREEGSSVDSDDTHSRGGTSFTTERSSRKPTSSLRSSLSATRTSENQSSLYSGDTSSSGRKSSSKGTSSKETSSKGTSSTYSSTTTEGSS